MPAIHSVRFGLLRHAATLANREKRIQGRTDSPLTGAGHRAALEWGRALAGRGFSMILVSDLPRALETARLVNRFLGLAMKVEPGIGEQDWGEWVGRTAAEIEAAHPEVLTAGWDFRPPGGESRTEVLDRSVKALAQAARAHPGGRILTITHQGVIRVLAYHLAGRRFLASEKPLPLKRDRLHWMDWGLEGLSLGRLNAPLG